MDIAKSSLKILGARICNSLSGFLAVIIFSRELGASPLGIYYPFIALIGILSIPANFGISKATEKRISEGEDASNYLGSAFALKIPLLILISFLLFLLRDPINTYLGADLGILLIIALFLNQLGGLSLNILRSELRVAETAILEAIRPVSWLIVGYIFYRLGHGIQALVYGYLVGSILVLILGWWKVSTKIGKPSFKHIQSLLDYGKFSAIADVGGYIYSWMDVAILSLFVSMEIMSTRGSIGAYENAWRLSLIVLIPSRAIATTLFPQFSRWDAENAVERIENTIPTVILAGLLISIPGFVGTLVLAEPLLGILFGAEFTVARLALIILSGEKILQCFHVVLGLSLRAIDRPDLSAYATIVSVFINLLLNFLLIWQFGIVGAAIATTVSFSVNTILTAWYLRKQINIKVPIREISWSVLASIVMGVCIYSIYSMFVVKSLFGLITLVVAGAVIYSLIISINGEIRSTADRILRPLI